LFCSLIKKKERLTNSLFFYFFFVDVSANSQNQVKSALLLDVVVGESAIVFKLFASENEALLIRGNSFLVLNLGFDIVNGVRAFNFESDCFASECLDKDLHSAAKSESVVVSLSSHDVLLWLYLLSISQTIAINFFFL